MTPRSTNSGLVIQPSYEFAGGFELYFFDLVVSIFLNGGYLFLCERIRFVLFVRYFGGLGTTRHGLASRRDVLRVWVCRVLGICVCRPQIALGAAAAIRPRTILCAMRERRPGPSMTGLQVLPGNRELGRRVRAARFVSGKAAAERARPCNFSTTIQAWAARRRPRRGGQSPVI